MPSPSTLSGNYQSRDTASTANDPDWRKLIPRRPNEVLLLALTVLVISMHLKYLVDVNTAVPHQDDWNLMDKMFRSLDTHRLGAYVFDRPNGHFMVPSALVFLVSLRYLSLDLCPLRLLNFPICLAAFFLTAHVINVGVRSRFLRFYLYLGACFLIFSLSHWVHFTLGFGFTTFLSALFGGVGLYYITKAVQLSWTHRYNLAVGLGFLIASILSFGAGYAAAAAAIALLALCGLKRLAVSRPIPGYQTGVYCMACVLGLLAVVSHPFFHLKSRILQTIFHAVLVAGCIGPSGFDTSSLMTQNIAFLCGVILVVASLSLGVDFLIRHASLGRQLPTFSLGLVLFGLLGCVAVAAGRPHLPGGEFIASRYTLYPSICLLGILLYFACARVFLLANIWCFSAACYLAATVKELQVAPYRPAVYNAVEIAIRNIDNLSDEQLRATLYWRENTEGVRRVAARMRANRLSIFRANVAPK